MLPTSAWRVTSPSVQTAEFWSSEEKKRQHNCLRVKTYPVCIASLFTTIQELGLTDILGQYNSIEICKKGRRNINRYPSRTGDTNSNSMQQKHNVRFICHHILEIQNTIVNRLSRKKIPLYKLSIAIEMVQPI